MSPILADMSEALAASSIDEGLDRKTLKTLKQRFLQVNAERLTRARLGLAPRHQQFIDLLPLLFHCNHPMLPGYVSHLAPAGVTDYRPDKRDIGRAQRLARSFTYRRQPNPQCEIQALFLMGSCGTVGQTERSDLDLWVCHGAELEPERERLLAQKANAISTWAQQELGLEVHCFLMEGQRFRRGERAALSAEDCGTSQHYLLLDEFYRTGLLLAGRIPVWWLVPATEEPQYNYYAETLRRKRFVRPLETLDFGGIAHIPAGEFIGAGIWQLSKAIDSPYKSVLKLLLTEVYASEYPAIEPLSHTFKRAIHSKQLDIDELDPYVMVYRRLERYLLARKETERLELVRRCFYFKVGKALSRAPTQRTKSWQRLMLEKLVAEWDWSPRYLADLDARHHWRVQRVIDEQTALVAELNRSYRYLQEFARRSEARALISSQEMALLGRKLYAAFERKAGKVEWINPGIAPDLSEELLTFAQLPGERGWCVMNDPNLTRDPNNASRAQPLKRERELLALLTWCLFNGLIGSATRLQICDGEHGVREQELQQLLRSLRWIQQPSAKEDSPDRYARANQPERIQLFINIGIDPLAALRERGVERLSSNTDSFGYSGLKDNLALSVDWLQQNAWGDLACRHFRGPQALLDCVRDYLSLLPPGRQPGLPRLEVHCFSPSRASAIAARVEELFRDLAACFYSGTRPPGTRYVLEIERAYYIIQCGEHGPRVTSANSVPALLELLGQAQPGNSPIVLDRYCQPGSALAAITAQARPEQVSVFYQRRHDRADVYVIDERGSLFTIDSPFRDERSLLHPLHQFLQATLFRRTGEGRDLETGELLLEPPTGELSYFELVDSPAGIRAIPRDPALTTAGRDFHVQAIAQRHGDDSIVFDIYCGGSAFTELEWGPEIHRAVARHILQHRRSAERYPCYITDLDLSLCQTQGTEQTTLYLRYKEHLERELNRALAEVEV